MTDELVPAATQRAAKRAFIRTTAQAYAASLPTGLTVGALGGVFDDPIKAALTIAAALLSPILAGGASYFSMIGNGIPDDYQAQ